MSLESPSSKPTLQLGSQTVICFFSNWFIFLVHGFILPSSFPHLLSRKRGRRREGGWMEGMEREREGRKREKGTLLLYRYANEGLTLCELVHCPIFFNVSSLQPNPGRFTLKTQHSHGWNEISHFNLPRLKALQKCTLKSICRWLNSTETFL